MPTNGNINAMALDFDGSRLLNPYLTPEHEAWRSQVRRFCDAEIAPHIHEWEEAGAVPGQLWRKAAEIGLLQVGFPEEFGGISQGIDHFYLNMVTEELTRAGSAGGLMSNLMIHTIGLPPIINFGGQDLRAQVAPAVLAGEKRISLAITEPAGGSDVANIRTTATREADAYVVSGSKTFISGVMHADWLTTAVRTGGAGASGISVLLVPTGLKGVSRTPLRQKQGWWCADTGAVYLDHVRVPAANLIGREGGGFGVLMSNFNSERLIMSATMEAAARVCLEEAVAWARERFTFGKRLADHQVIRHKIAEMKRRINATQAYLQYMTHAHDQRRCHPGDLAMLKVQASEAMEFCAREASQILGGASYLRGNRVERFYREVRVNAIGGGSEEIMRDLAASQYRL